VLLCSALRARLALPFTSRAKERGRRNADRRTEEGRKGRERRTSAGATGDRHRPDRAADRPTAAALWPPDNPAHTIADTKGRTRVCMPVL
jgi:hypothetical protein